VTVSEGGRTVGSFATVTTYFHIDSLAWGNANLSSDYCSLSTWGTIWATILALTGFATFATCTTNHYHL
jgi:hypothetical protein